MTFRWTIWIFGGVVGVVKPSVWGYQLCQSINHHKTTKPRCHTSPRAQEMISYLFEARAELTRCQKWWPLLGGGFVHTFLFSLRTGKMKPFWRAYFSKWVGSTTNQCWYLDIFREVDDVSINRRHKNVQKWLVWWLVGLVGFCLW